MKSNECRRFHSYELVEMCQLCASNSCLILLSLKNSQHHFDSLQSIFIAPGQRPRTGANYCTLFISLPLLFHDTVCFVPLPFLVPRQNGAAILRGLVECQHTTTLSAEEKDLLMPQVRFLFHSRIASEADSTIPYCNHSLPAGVMFVVPYGCVGDCLTKSEQLFPVKSCGFTALLLYVCFVACWSWYL